MLLYLKAFHVLSVLLWMGSLLTLGVLLEFSKETVGAEREKLGILGKKLYLRLAAPAMGATLTLGTLLIVLHPDADYFKTSSWLHTKLLFVFGLMVVDHLLMRRTRKLTAEQGAASPMKAMMLAAVLVLLAVIFAVVKPFTVG